MRVLLTGGAGFIGSHVTERLLADGHEVLSLDNFDPAYPREYKERNLVPVRSKSGFRFVEADIRDRARVRDLFEDFTPEALVHLAAKTGVRSSLADPAVYLDVNLGGTLVLLEAARDFGARKVLFASSSSVYGANENLPFGESDRVDCPVSVYAMTKKAGEELCFACHHLYDLDIVALRFFTVYGPRNRPDMAIHKFAHLMMSGRSIPVFGTGRMERDWTYVEDAVEGCRAALDFLASRDSVYEIFNIASSHPVALETMIELLEESLGRQAERRLMPSQPGDVRATWGDIRKARERLGYSPRIPIETGVERFVAWFRREILALPLERRAVVQEA